MKKNVSIVAIALALSACTANFSSGNVKVGNGKQVLCKGTVVERSFDLSGFDAIAINGQADIEIYQGTEWSVRVVANEMVFDYLNYRVVDGSVLVLETLNHVNIVAEEYDIYITLPVLTDITVNGAADMSLKRGYSADKNLRVLVNGAGDLDISSVEVPALSVELKGAGDIDLHSIKVGRLRVDVKGAGDVEVSGKADEASFSVSGAGAIDARRLDCPKVEKSRAGVAVIRTK